MASRGSSAWRKEHWGPGCQVSVMVTGPWVIGAGNIQCHRHAVRPFRALGRIMRKYRYQVRSNVTGCYNCRVITGGSSVSSHAQGIGIDVNWDTNPYRTDRLVTDMPRAMIEEIEALETDAGVRVFRWGGDWDGRPETPHSNYDGMHFELIATPEELIPGFSIPLFDESQPLNYPLLALNEKGEAVRQLQRQLLVGVDGYFGPKTEMAVKQYQTSRGLKPDGWVGLATWTALFTRMPPGGPSPSKNQQPCP